MSKLMRTQIRAQPKIKNLLQTVKAAPSAFQKNFNLWICGNPKKPKDLGNQAAFLFVIFGYIYIGIKIKFKG